MTRHVLHISQPTTEGVPRVVAGLVRHQVAAGFRVTVASPGTGWLADEAVAAGAEHVEWAATRSPGPAVASETARLLEVVRSLRPDLVHLHSAKAGLAGRLALHGRVPTVYQPHGWSFLAVQGAMRTASVQWERLAVRWASRIACVSKAEYRDGLAQGLRLAGRARVVSNGVDTDRFQPGDRKAARVALGLADEPLAVCVGRLSEQKGQDLLIDAWAAVRVRVPDARLALVGDGPWQARLEQRAEPRVLFSGNAVDPRPWFAAADVVVVPSRWEGMALVVLEAGASARTVVVTEVAGAREQVPWGCGEVVPREDPSALADALVSRLQDRRRADSEGEALRRHVQGSYSLRASADAMLALYDDALGLG